jgi:hypothetical protein
MNTKPGVKTTEFWLTLVAMIVSTLAASGGLDPSSPVAKIVGLAAAVLAAMGYSISRGIAKQGNV